MSKTITGAVAELAHRYHSLDFDINEEGFNIMYVLFEDGELCRTFRKPDAAKLDVISPSFGESFGPFPMKSSRFTKTCCVVTESQAYELIMLIEATLKERGVDVSKRRQDRDRFSCVFDKSALDILAELKSFVRLFGDIEEHGSAKMFNELGYLDEVDLGTVVSDFHFFVEACEKNLVAVSGIAVPPPQFLPSRKDRRQRLIRHRSGDPKDTSVPADDRV